MEEKGDVSNEPIQDKNEEPTLEQPTNDLPSLISDIEEGLLMLYSQKFFEVIGPDIAVYPAKAGQKQLMFTQT